MGLFKDWGVTNLTLKRKVKRRLSKKKLKKRTDSKDYTGRTYTDYLEYKIQNPNIVTTRWTQFIIIKQVHIFKLLYLKTLHL